MPVLSATELMGQRLNALEEHACDFSRQLPVARAIREQVDWDEVRAVTAANPFAVAFLFLLERLDVIEPGSRGSTTWASAVGSRRRQHAPTELQAVDPPLERLRPAAHRPRSRTARAHRRIRGADRSRAAAWAPPPRCGVTSTSQSASRRRRTAPRSVWPDASAVRARRPGSCGRPTRRTSRSRRTARQAWATARPAPRRRRRVPAPVGLSPREMHDSLGMSDQVGIPLRVLGQSALRRHDDELGAVLEIQQGRGEDLAGLAAEVLQQEDWDGFAESRSYAPCRPDPAIGQPEHTHLGLGPVLDELARDGGVQSGRPFVRQAEPTHLRCLPLGPWFRRGGSGRVRACGDPTTGCVRRRSGPRRDCEA